MLLGSDREAERGLTRGIVKYVRLHGPWLLLTPAPYYMTGPTGETETAGHGGQIDGVILPDTREVKEFSKRKIPLVLLAAREPCEGQARIIGDTWATSRMAAEHLLELGFRRFAYCGYAGIYWSEERFRRFQERVNEQGFAVSLYEVSSYKEGQSGDADRSKGKQESLTEWLGCLAKPVGVFVCNDDLAKEVSKACQIARIEVPTEVAILGVDNDEMVCGLANPPLSSIVQSFEQAGYDAAAILDRLMAGKEATCQDVVIEPVRVVQRQSTNSLAVDDAVVREGLRFIRQHAKHPIQVQDVVEAVTVSRSFLNQRFRKALGRSVHKEIRRVRSERIAQMLAETTRTISEIAQSLDFAGPDHIARYFHQEKGMSPRMYRKSLHR